VRLPVRKLLSNTIILSTVLLPLAAHADTIDDFVLTGGGHTISYSLPATSTFPNDLSIEFFYESATATIDGVPGYVVRGAYDVIPSGFATLQLDVPESIFGYPSIQFQGPQLDSYVLVPSNNPDNPFDIAATFIPGTYSLVGEGMFPPVQSGPPLPYTLTITPETATATTPEPSSLALLGTGILCIVGFAAIKRGRIEHLARSSRDAPQFS
jgi:hypothetical protein